MVVPNAQSKLEGALDEIDRCNDFWMPFDQKMQHIGDALTKMVQITPDMIRDTMDCPALKDNTEQNMKWLDQNGYMFDGSLYTKIANNFLKEAMPIMGHMTTGLTKW